MSEILDKAAAALGEKIGDRSFGAVVIFHIEGEGRICVDGEKSPPVVSTQPAEGAVTITATKETFQKIIAGELNPVAAAMTGAMKIDGDMGAAMKLADSLR